MRHGRGYWLTDQHLKPLAGIPSYATIDEAVFRARKYSIKYNFTIVIRYSDGYTLEPIAVAFDRQVYKAMICPHCRGDRDIDCAHCDSWGLNVDTNKPYAI